MSLFSALRTSVSGMNAQSSYLSSIGDNIANSSTVGYKDASTEFETVLGQQSPGSYNSGGVLADTTYGVTDQGTLNSTSSATDLAIQGGGFFVVSQDGSSANMLTRSGSFSPDTNGNLVNTAGYTLMGYAIGTDGTKATTLSAVNISSTTLKALPTTSGSLTGNLPSTDAVATAANPTSEATTLTVFDSLGAPITTTLNFAKTGANQWSVTATNSAGAPVTQTLNFTSNGTLPSGTSITINTSSTTTATIDLSAMTQLASSFSSVPVVNGNAPSALSTVSVGSDGTLTGIYGNGAKSVLYDIPVATVTSPNNLTSVSGNIFQQSNTSGAVVIGQAGSGAAGVIKGDNLEASTVDLATELTNMIVAQRSYEANSKVLQAAADLLSKLNQIQTG